MIDYTDIMFTKLDFINLMINKDQINTHLV